MWETEFGGQGGRMWVQIKDIVDCLEMANDDYEHFLNTETGEIVSLSNGFSAEVDEELEEQTSSICKLRKKEI